MHNGGGLGISNTLSLILTTFSIEKAIDLKGQLCYACIVTPLKDNFKTRDPIESKLLIFLVCHSDTYATNRYCLSTALSLHITRIYFNVFGHLKLNFLHSKFAIFVWWRCCIGLPPLAGCGAQQYHQLIFQVF